MLLYSYARNAPVLYADAFGLKPGDPYDSPDLAAIAALQEINCQSIKEDREYCGRIYQCRDGKSFSYTKARPGTAFECMPGAWPKGTEKAGSYHTHGAPSKYAEVFSPEDKDMDPFNPNYLATPSCQIYKYDPVLAAGPDGKTGVSKIGETPPCK
jgi:hypothetical protein